MTTIKAAQSGYWSSATTWTGGTIPGTGDIVDLFGFVVTERDSRQIYQIINTSGVQTSGFIIDTTVLGTTVTLTFDDVASAGFGSTNGRYAYFKVVASSKRATLKSSTASPTNRWIWPGGGGTWNLTAMGVRNCDFKDFFNGGLIIAQATATDPWATFATCNFLGNGVQVDAYLGAKTRFTNCVFNNIRVLRSGGEGHYVYLSGASFTNGATFGISASVNAGIMASRDHDRVSGDYRVWVPTGGNGKTVISYLQASDRPTSTDHVKVITSNADLTLDIAASASIGGYDMYDRTGVLRIPDGIEIIVRGTFTQRTSFIDLALSGRLINHATGAATFAIWCGSSLNKSSLVEDFGATNNVIIRQGRLLADETITHANMTVEAPATLVVNPGITHTVGAGKTLQAMSSNAIQWNGMPESRITLKSSAPGTSFNLNIQRGRTLSSAGIANYSIQPLQHPIATAKGGKTHFGFLNAIGNEPGFFGTRPLVRWRIGTFDESTASWSFNNLDTGNDADADGHKFVSLIHNSSGVLHAMYDAHIEPLKRRYSNATNNASAWTQGANLFTDASYPSIARPPQSTVLYVLFRENGEKDARFSKSIDGGLTWSAQTALARAVGSGTFTRCYPLSGLAASGSQTLHVAASWRSSDTLPTGARKDSNPWYMTSPDGGTTWKNAGGTTLVLPVNYTEAGSFRVFSGFMAFSDGIAVTSSGVPHTIYHRQDTNPHSLWHASWDGIQWIRTQISAAGQWVFGYGAPTAKIAIDAEDTIWIGWAYATSGPDPTTASFSVTGNVHVVLSSSYDSGITWAHQEIYQIDGPALVPQYVNIFADRVTSKVHIFWIGSPAGSSADEYGIRGVMWEEAKNMRPLYVSGVNVSDCNATGGTAPPFASDSIDGGGNSGWIFRNRLPTPLIPTRVARKYRMYKREVV